VLGLNGTPSAGDELSVVESEARAREITAFRQRRKLSEKQAAGARGTLEQMFSQIAAGVAKELPVVVKSDVQGSLEAIVGSLEKLSTSEVSMRVLHSAVGGINESDVILAKATNAVIVGFNVRANPQARDLAQRDGVEIRYYSIIYDVIDDMRNALSGLLAPSLRERLLGNAAIREVFNITRVGKVAGCRVTEGVVKRGAKVRLLRDNVVIHEGVLKTLRRFKDEVREVQHGFECGVMVAGWNELKQGDVIEVISPQSTELRYQVKESVSYPVATIPMKTVLYPGGGDQITLITCAGHYQPGSGYDRRLVIRALPAV
jgi:translation initiation factor IF-2